MKRLIIIFCALCLTACGPSQGQIQTAIAQTQSAQPTPTVQPTNTELPKPSATAAPTETQAPTKTPAPTTTPTTEPTATPEPQPIVLEGKGDSVVDAAVWDGPAIVHITGNQGSRFFAVTNLDADNQEIDLLVNTTEPYDGVRPIDFDGRQQTTRFQVQAVGAWKIEVLPFGSIRQVDTPGDAKGKGDDVFFVCCKTLDTATIGGNQESRFFAVEVYYDDGADLLVNTTDTYGGIVPLKAKDKAVFVVQAVGEWFVTLDTK